MNKYELAIHNLRMANIVHENNEQLYQENNNDLDVLEEAVKRNEELESVAKKYEELKNKYSRCCYVCKDRDLNTCKHLNKPTTLETFIECQELNQVYLAKRIEELEHLCKCHEGAIDHNCKLFEREQEKNKVLVDYFAGLDLDTLIILEKKKIEEWCEREMTLLPPREMFDSILKFCETNKNLELLKKIKEMLGK